MSVSSATSMCCWLLYDNYDAVDGVVLRGVITLSGKRVENYYIIGSKFITLSVDVITL